MFIMCIIDTYMLCHNAHHTGYVSIMYIIDKSTCLHHTHIHVYVMPVMYIYTH